MRSLRVAAVRADFIHQRMYFLDEAGKFSMNARAVSLLILDYGLLALRVVNNLTAPSSSSLLSLDWTQPEHRPSLAGSG